MTSFEMSYRWYQNQLAIPPRRLTEVYWLNAPKELESLSYAMHVKTNPNLIAFDGPSWVALQVLMPILRWRKHD